MPSDHNTCAQNFIIRDLYLFSKLANIIDDDMQENIIHKMQWDVEGIKSSSKDCASPVLVAAKNCNPMLFWKKNHGNLPILSRVARYFLISPGGTETQERFFSVMKMNRTSKRTSLEMEKLEVLTLLRESQLFIDTMRNRLIKQTNKVKGESLWQEFDSEEE